MQGYIDAFTQIHLHDYILNSLIYAVGGTVRRADRTAFLAAYPLARFHFLGQGLLYATFALALAIPACRAGHSGVLHRPRTRPVRLQVGLVVLYAALQFPFTFVVLRSFLQTFPPRLEEAAIVDGAGYFTTFATRDPSSLRPAIATVSVVAFVQIWNEFFFANLLTVSTENQNVQLALAAFKSQFGFNITGALAGATIIMLVPIALFLILQRQVIAGLTSGAVK